MANKNITLKDDNDEIYPKTYDYNVYNSSNVSLDNVIQTKANIDATNLSNTNILNWQTTLNDLATPNLTDNVAHTQTGQAVVVESYLSSNKKTWYRKWSDGWKECGGTITENNTSSNRDVTKTFPLTFQNNPTVNFNMIRTSSGTQEQMYGWIKSISTTNFTFNSYFGSATLDYEWTARGY